MCKILMCFGTRPEAIKMASLVHILKTEPSFDVKVCVTAQHREMLDQVLDFFDIVPDFDLDIMEPNQTLNKISSKILSGIESVLSFFQPDLLLVHGDTTTSTLCALAAFHRGIKVGHIEAGLRTFDKNSPFPEEMNRVLTGQLANYHFAPTEKSAENLYKENIPSKFIITTGNTVIDSLLWADNKLASGYRNDKILELESLINMDKRIILVTAHRRENFGEAISNICDALEYIATSKDVEIVYPVHPNPNIKKTVEERLGKIANIKLIDPLDYPSFIWLMKKSYVILTDSGGVQEEAPSLGKPVLVMRDTTERPEAVEAGTVLLIGTKKNIIVDCVSKLLDDNSVYDNMSKAHNPYGDGNANLRILNFLKNGN